jgi:hypothetical protein
MLAEKVVDLLDGGAGAEGDGLAAAAVDDVRVARSLVEKMTWIRTSERDCGIRGWLGLAFSP